MKPGEEPKIYGEYPLTTSKGTKMSNRCEQCGEVANPDGSCACNKKPKSTVPFDVVIPNQERTAIIRTVRIDVPTVISDGVVVLTPEALDLIEKTQRNHMERKPCPLCGKFEDEGQLHTVYRCDGALRQLADVQKKI